MQDDLDVREQLRGERKKTRQGRVADHRGEPDANRAAHALRNAPHGYFRVTRYRDQAPGLDQEGRPGCGQLRSSLRPVEQADLQVTLKGLDLPTQRGLGQVQPLGGTAEVLLLSDRDEGLELVEREPHTQNG